VTRASIVYWFAGDQLRKDGGGMRALAWQQALDSLGFDAEIVGLRVLGASGGPASSLSRIKRAVFPMPFEQRLPELNGADLVIATVPGVFRSAAELVPRERLVFDWMDLWSTSALSMRSTSPVAGPGSALQAKAWRRRERTLPSRARGNVYAGFEDFERMRGPGSAHEWLPNPLPFVGGDARRSSVGRRLGFIGSLNYPPNEASLRQFFGRYSTRLADAGFEVVVAGFGSDRVREWDVAATVLGEVDSPDVLYREVDAVIVPVDHGGGIKIKAIEALSYGLPVFATHHVRQGFSPEFQSHILDLDQLFDDDIVIPDPVEREQFDAVFSQEAFTRVVESVIHA
jgi:hypothetical protein